jgi:hypothetical protein
MARKAFSVWLAAGALVDEALHNAGELERSLFSTSASSDHEDKLSLIPPIG